jgi:formate dehydrogenase subunit gamma
MSEQKHYLRFSVAQRIEHWVQMLSFFLLGFTGLPQKFAGEGWAETLIAMLGGIENVRNIHHAAAIAMALACIYHVIAVAYKVFVLRVRWTMFPRLDDLLDALDVIRYNLGLTKERPQFDRYSFEEKAEYWAFVWGAIIMGITGFMMWNPINTARFVPGDLIPAAKAAHGGEALLAVLAIIVWHFYSVHIKMFNTSMFTGKLSEHEMEHEHGLELQRIKAGKVDPRPAPEVIKQRERWFIPIATVLSVSMLVVLYLFVNYEQTAITTLPKRATVQVYAPITLTPTPRAGAPTVSVTVKVLPASHAGRTTCMACHQNLTQPKLPADHAGRTDATCSACHAPAGSAPAAGTTPPATTAPASSGVAKALPASHAGRTTCNVCHETGTAGPKNPADHAGRADATCVACHKPAASAPATTAPAATKPPASSSSASAPTVAPTKASTSSTSGGAKVLPASHAGRTTCNVCHETGVGGAPKNPADHAGRTDAMCVACHKLP